MQAETQARSFPLAPGYGGEGWGEGTSGPVCSPVIAKTGAQYPESRP
jgi:hypothetical protein